MSDRRPGRLLRLLAVSGILTVLATACAAGDGNGSADAEPTAESPASQPQQNADLPEPLPAAEGELTQVRLAQSVPALSFAPLDVARHMNFFENQGVSLEFIELQSGTSATSALVGGDVDLIDSASTDMIGAVAGGVDHLSVQGTINMTMQLCARTDWLEERGVTPDDPLTDRLAALEGATLGITGPGAVSDRALRWMLSEYGGLNPNKDTVITQIGSGQSMATALKNDQIQGFLLSPPACELAGGQGVVLVPPSDVPEFANYIHEVLYGMRPWVEENEETVSKVATALSMGNNYIIQNPEESKLILQEVWSDVDGDIISQAFDRVILPQVEAVESGLMTEEQWEATNSLLVAAGLIDKAVDVSEGSFWTNQYIDGDTAQQLTP